MGLWVGEKRVPTRGKGLSPGMKTMRKWHAAHPHSSPWPTSVTWPPLTPRSLGNFLSTAVFPQKGRSALASGGGVPLFSRVDPVKGESERVPATLAQHAKGTAPPQCPLAASQGPSSELSASRLGPPSPTSALFPKPGPWAGQAQGSLLGLTWAGRPALLADTANPGKLRTIPIPVARCYTYSWKQDSFGKQPAGARSAHPSGAHPGGRGSLPRPSGQQPPSPPARRPEQALGRAEPHSESRAGPDPPLASPPQVRSV